MCWMGVGVGGGTVTVLQGQILNLKIVLLKQDESPKANANRLLLLVE